jgi:predicted dehydrogenase
MRIGLAGTGAIAHKHAEAYASIGFQLAACWNRNSSRGRAFAEKWNARYVESLERLCELPDLDFIDVCTFPDGHLDAVRLCASARRAVQLQKPIAPNLKQAWQIIDLAAAADICLSVVSQHRFDDSTLFLKRAIAQGRLGNILEADAYVKWYRDDAYYTRPGKGMWQVEGGGALINQAIHQIDLLLLLNGPVRRVFGRWQLGAAHSIESEDLVNALLEYESGGTGVIQASTAFWPGQSERIEIHGTQGTATITGDLLSVWKARGDEAANATDPAPVRQGGMSGASDPMAIGLTAFERQFTDFAEAITTRRQPYASGRAGFDALAVVEAIYTSCRSGAPAEVPKY